MASGKIVHKKPTVTVVLTGAVLFKAGHFIKMSRKTMRMGVNESYCRFNGKGKCP